MFLKIKKQVQQYRPKIWIYADMEGINNITKWEEVNPAYIQYKKGAELMTEELNSAVRGILKSDTERIFVNDLHWFYNNLDWSEIDKNVVSCAGANLNIREFCSKYFDAVFIVGMHAKAGAEDGILPHSWYLPEYIKSLKYNGKFIGEIKLIQLLAEEKGVPVIFMSGDKAGCEEAEKTCKNIVLAQTKEIDSNGEIQLMPRKKANKLVYTKAREAIKLLRTMQAKPLKACVSSLPLEATFASKKIADSVEARCEYLNVPYENIKSQTLKFTGSCFSKILANFFSVLD